MQVNTQTTGVAVATVETTNNDTIVGSDPIKSKAGRPKTMITLRRVVFEDGKVAGKGRPSKDQVSKRTFAYVPMTVSFVGGKRTVTMEDYNPNIHGETLPFPENSKNIPSIIRMSVDSYNKMTGDHLPVMEKIGEETVTSTPTPTPQLS